jgi:uncharacterized SAM-binding protein YcdF (DUF218 family)
MAAKSADDVTPIVNETQSGRKRCNRGGQQEHVGALLGFSRPGGSHQKESGVEQERLERPDIMDAAETLWRYHAVQDTLEPCDAIVGLGSYDLRVADRCAALLLAGYAPRLVFTGAHGHWTRGRFAGSEAAAFAERAAALGVPPEAILLEEQATNIGENIRFSATMLPGCRRVILVTKPQTRRRCLATARMQWPDAETIVTAPLHAFHEQPIAGHGMDDLISEMVGDIDRIRRYPQAGFQIPQDEPGEVAAAYDLLVAAGYTGHISEG